MIIPLSQQEEMKMSAAVFSFKDDNNNKMDSMELNKFCKITDDCCQQDKKIVDLTNFLTFRNLNETLCNEATKPASTCTNNVCYSGVATAPDSNKLEKSPEFVAIEAKRLLDQYFNSISKNNIDIDMYEKRLLEILNSIQKIGTYDLTFEELEFGVRMAYRNSSFITDRWEWENMKVFDARYVKTAEQMFDAICNLLKYVTNDGKVRNAVTVFPNRKNGSSFRIWNAKLIAYAGYQQEDGSIVGDPAQLKLTQLCELLGWISPSQRKSAFDVLPLLLNVQGQDPKCFDIPKELVLQVDIKHPNYKWFEELGLKWYAVHSVSNMAADIGGLQFTAAPYCGAQLSAEVASRDLCDPYRYNILEEVAFGMGLDTLSIVNLWKDQALVEVNIAVVNSYLENKVSILDHHTASEMFVQYFISEVKQRGGCPANWSAIVPPISSGLTNVFHQEMLIYKLKPCFEKQQDAWKSHTWIKSNVLKRDGACKASIRSAANVIQLATYYMNKCLQRRVKATIVYASETGKSEMFARRLGNLFKRAFNIEVVAMDNYDLNRLPKEELILAVASTFGSGDAPQNGKVFGQNIAKIDGTDSCTSNKKPRFAVFALGSSAYPDFCAFGKYCDESLNNIGYSRLLPVATGDEIKSQEKTFKMWANEIFKVCCDEFEIIYNFNEDSSFGDEEDLPIDCMRIATSSQPNNVRDLVKGLSEIHQKNVVACNMTSRIQLQAPNSERQTILVRLNTEKTPVNYVPGDHLGVFPVNPADQVRAICSRIKQLSGDESALNDIVSVRAVDRENLKGGRVQSWKVAGRLPPCSVWTALSNYLDITTPPTQSLLKRFSEAATNIVDRLAIEKLVQNDDEYQKWKSTCYPSVADVLEAFPSVILDLRVVLTQFAILQPRFYSISSSTQQNPSEVHLTVAVVNYNVQGKHRRGICSNYLNDFPSDPVPCFVRSATNFRMPKDAETPLIMVGPGTGIAPFRSFWQQRKYEVETMPTGTKFGQMILYFGCRQPGVDDIYSKELQSLTTGRYQFQAKVAFSRANNRPKKYVQKLLEEDSLDVYAHLTKNNGHFYVCGEAAMAVDVRNTLRAILKAEGGMDSEQASKYLNKLKDEGRFQEDIFGVVVKSS